MITIWRGELDLPAERLSGCTAVLSADELARARRFLTLGLQQRYIAARGQLRYLLAAELGKSPHEVSFAYGEYGKPYVPGSDVQFNLTHTDSCMVCAITRIYAVGVDMEDTRREVEYVPVAEQFFAPDDVSALRRAPAAEQCLLFFQLWTRQEAYLKARGLGLGIAQNRAGEPRLTVDGSALIAPDGTRWSVVSFEPFPDHFATLVTAAPDAAYQLLTYQGE